MKWNLITLVLAVTISGIMISMQAGDSEAPADVEKIKAENRLLAKAVDDLRQEIADLKEMDVSDRQIDAYGVGSAPAATTTGQPTDPIIPTRAPEPKIPAGTTVEDILASPEQRDALQSQVYAWIDNRKKEDAREDLKRYHRQLEEKRKKKYFKQFKLDDSLKEQWNEILKEHYKVIDSLNEKKYAVYDGGGNRNDMKDINKNLHKANMEKLKKIKSLLTPDQAKKFQKDLRSSHKADNDPNGMLSHLHSKAK